MKFVDIQFKNGRKLYTYKTDIDLIVNGIYSIIADFSTKYDSNVTVKATYNYDKKHDSGYRTITNATLVSAPRRVNYIKNVYFNEEKGVTTVVWVDGTKTIVKCQEGDSFDKEKGIMACFMKKMHNNRGYYNEYLKKYCNV